MEIAIIVALIGSAGGILLGVGNILTARNGGQKIRGDFAQQMVETSASLLAPLTKRIETLESETRQQKAEIGLLREANEVLKARLSVFEGGVVLLVNQLQSVGHKPIWTPPAPIVSRDAGNK